MPPTFDMVETSCIMLLEAAKGLSQEEQSATDKKKLLDGSRGDDIINCLLVSEQVFLLD